MAGGLDQLGAAAEQKIEPDADAQDDETHDDIMMDRQSNQTVRH